MRNLRAVFALAIVLLVSGIVVPCALAQGSAQEVAQGAGVASSEETSTEITYERGDVVRVPAPVGFNPSSLGMGRPMSGGGFSAARVLPRRTTPQDVNEYSATLRRQESQFQLSATADALGLVSGQWRDATERRYALLTVQHVSRVERLSAPSLPPEGSSADYFISAIYYGWSLHAMIRGRASTFTAGVAADLENIINVGGSMEQAVRDNQLTREVKLRGLAPRGGEIPIALSPGEVQEQFVIGEAQPVAVEYTFLRDVAVGRIPWTEPGMGPGTYRVEEIGVRLANQNGSRNWDLFGAPPDPTVTLYVNGQEEYTVGRRRNGLSATFTPGRLIDIYGGTSIQLRIDDDDPGQVVDRAGSASLTYDDLIQGTPGKRIDMRTEGQVAEAWIRLALEERGGSAPDEEAQGSAPNSEIESVYQDPERIFQVGQPGGWSVERGAQRLQNGVYAVSTMMAPPSARRAELNGYLSHGVRINLWVAPPGQRAQVDVRQWAPQSIRSMMQKTQGFTLTDSVATPVAGQEAIGYGLVGENPAIIEPEKTEIYFFTGERYTGQVELTSPASRWQSQERLLESVLRSLDVRADQLPGH